MRFTRLSHLKKNKMLQCFVEDVPASVASRLVLVNRKTANAWYAELRKRLLVKLHGLPALVDDGRFLAYHKRRTVRFNGVSKASERTFILESRIRYQLKSAFRGALLDVTSDLIE
jgi:hypothetical protein